MVSQFGSLGYTIMGKTPDLIVVQKTIIDTLHKEDKPQTFIAKEASCSQSAVSKHVNRKLSGRKKCTTKSNQIKSLLLSHHHSTSALVSEILMSVLQTVQKKNNNNNLHMDRQCKKTTTTIYIWTDSAKKQQTIYIWTDSAKKQQTIYIWTDSAKKQQQFTYGQYIFTDYTEDNVQNTHTYTQYT